MVIISVSVPDDLKKRMDKTDTKNWSAVARNAFERELLKEHTMEELEKLLELDQLVEKDALEIGRMINKNLHNRYKKKSP